MKSSPNKFPLSKCFAGPDKILYVYVVFISWGSFS